MERSPFLHVVRVVGQAPHTVWPGEAVNVPFAQSEQLLAPGDAAALPIGQGSGGASAPSHLKPGGHGSANAELLR